MPPLPPRRSWRPGLGAGDGESSSATTSRCSSVDRHERREASGSGGCAAPPPSAPGQLGVWLGRAPPAPAAAGRSVILAERWSKSEGKKGLVSNVLIARSARKKTTRLDPTQFLQTHSASRAAALASRLCERIIGTSSRHPGGDRYAGDGTAHHEQPRSACRQRCDVTRLSVNVDPLVPPTPASFRTGCYLHTHPCMHVMSAWRCGAAARGGRLRQRPCPPKFGQRTGTLSDAGANASTSKSVDASAERCVRARAVYS